MLVPAGQFHCQELQAAVHPQMHVMQGSMNFAHIHQDWKTESQAFYSIDSNSCKHGDAADDTTTQGSYSDPDQSKVSSEWELSPCRLKPTSSQARRLRRKRLIESCTNQSTTAGPRKNLPKMSACESPSVLCSDVERLEGLKLMLSEGGRKGVLDALPAIRGNVWKLSCDPVGCRLVQLALKRVNQQEASELVVELHGHVQEAITSQGISQHANYVIQEVVKQLPPHAASFVAKELKGSCAKLASHRIGCRILCRLLEFCSTQSLTFELVDELLAEAKELCKHGFAHHVMQMVLEHGSQRHRKQVVAALLSNPLEYAADKKASFVIEAALRHGCQEDKQLLLAQLSHPAAIAGLAISQFGSFVAKAVLQAQGLDALGVLHTIGHIMPQLLMTKHGQRLLVDLGFATAAEH